MANIVIVPSLYKEINKKFKREAVTILNHIYSLRNNPRKGKTVGYAGGVLIKELKYKGFRFYFLIEGQHIRVIDENQLVDLLIRFVRMSDKKRQQEAIEEIRQVLLHIGPEGFE